MAELSFRGGTISYTVSGKGNTVVLLHGFLENKEIWNDFSEKLSARNRVVLIDLPGHGETSNFGYSHGMELMADCVMAVLRFLKVRKVRLIGHSMGGYVAISFADKFPDSTNGICFFHSTVSDDPEQKKKERDKLIKLVQRDRDLFIREAIPHLFNTAYKPYKRLIEKHLSMSRKMSLQGIIAALEGMKNRHDKQLVLRFAPFPILYLIGRYDNILPYQKLIDECSINPQAKYVLLENSGHMGFYEEPEESYAAIRSFLLTNYKL